MPVRVLFGQLSAEVAGCGIDVDLALAQAAFEFGVACLDGVSGVAGHDEDEVALGGSGQFADLGGRLREALG